MLKLDTDSILWCQERLDAAGADAVVIVSMYKDGFEGTTNELGILLHLGNESLEIPLTYYTSEPSYNTFVAYSWLIDDYVKYMKSMGIPVRRVLADFEQ